LQIENNCRHPSAGLHKVIGAYNVRGILPRDHLIGKDGAKELGCPYSASRRAKKVVNMKCQRSVFQTLGGRWKGRADLMPNNVVKLVASLLHEFLSIANERAREPLDLKMVKPSLQ